MVFALSCSVRTLKAGLSRAEKPSPPSAPSPPSRPAPAVRDDRLPSQRCLRLVFYFYYYLFLQHFLSLFFQSKKVKFFILTFIVGNLMSQLVEKNKVFHIRNSVGMNYCSFPAEVAADLAVPATSCRVTHVVQLCNGAKKMGIKKNNKTLRILSAPPVSKTVACASSILFL